MYRKSFLKDEGGVTMILFVMTLAVIIGIVALVVDLGKQELALTQLRQSADAAALSGARQLNGRPDGWRASKIAAAMILKAYPIHGVDPAWRANLQLSAGDRAYWDGVPTSGYSVNPPRTHVGTTGEVGGYHVRVRRGLYRARLDDPGKKEFVSLEPAGEGEVMSGDAYLFANAVEVDVRLDYLQGFFSRIFNTLGFENMHATSYSVMDSSVERLVAPIAFAYNDLMLDTWPQTFSASHQMATYTPENEYARHVEISFMNKDGRQDMLSENPPIDAGGRLFIDGGVERYRSFQRLPYTTYYSVADKPEYPRDVCKDGMFTGTDRNCKAISARPFFAMVGDADVSPEMIVRAFEQGGIRAHVGDTITGLMNLGAFAQDPALSQRMTDVINSSPVTFDEFFRKGGNILPNYPLLRAEQQGHRDQILSYPSDVPARPGVAQKTQDFLMDNMAKQGPGNSQQGLGTLNFINPMCHFDGIPLNDLTQNKVREVWAMVVAPRRNTTQSGRKINYIDFPAMFAGGPQNAIAAVPETLPTVVGFVKIGIYDGNFLNLEARFPVSALPPPSNKDVYKRTATPRYGSYATSNYVYDNNPWALDLSDSSFAKNLDSFSGRVDETYACFDKSDPDERAKCDAPTAAPLPDNIADILNCFNFRQFMTPVSSALFSGLLGEGGKLKVICEDDYKECGYKKSSDCRGCSKGGGCCDRLGYGNGRSKISDVLFTLLSIIHKGPIPSNPDTHCLYVLRADSEDRNDLTSYNPLKPVEAGYGCGGLEGALAVTSHRSDDYVNLVSGSQWSQQSPALVNVSE